METNIAVGELEQFYYNKKPKKICFTSRDFYNSERNSAIILRTEFFDIKVYSVDDMIYLKGNDCDALISGISSAKIIGSIEDPLYQIRLVCGIPALGNVEEYTLYIMN